MRGSCWLHGQRGPPARVSPSGLSRCPGQRADIQKTRHAESIVALVVGKIFRGIRERSWRMLADASLASGRDGATRSLRFSSRQFHKTCPAHGQGRRYAFQRCSIRLPCRQAELADHLWLSYRGGRARARARAARTMDGRGRPPLISVPCERSLRFCCRSLTTGRSSW